MTEQTPPGGVGSDAEGADQDAGPTMTAPGELRPDAGTLADTAGGRGDSPDAVDADSDADETEGEQP